MSQSISRDVLATLERRENRVQNPLRLPSAIGWSYDALAEFAGSGFGAGLPVGFSVSVRSTPGKPRGYVEWQATCRHGSFNLDRASKLAELFKEHAKCRWDILHLLT